MNIVAQSVSLKPGDEVLLNDHEYGAVLRIWERACRRAGAQMVVCSLPHCLESGQQIVDCLSAAITPRTRLVVVSHVTSPTALIFPLAEIVAAAHAQGVSVAVDGPHAVGMLPLDLASLGADFYCASCHKWLSAPLGSGFLHVQPRWQSTMESPLRSWGRAQPGKPASWRDEFEWLGTRDPAAALSLPTAIDWMESLVPQSWPTLQQLSHAAAVEFQAEYSQRFGQRPLTTDGDGWFGSMVAVPLPDGDAPSLQAALWERYQIEIPIVAFNGRRLIRLSWHAYNQPEDRARLDRAVRELLGG